MKFLITGGAGFIGYHLTNHILQQDPKNEVIIVDDLTSPCLLFDKNNLESNFIKTKIQPFYVFHCLTSPDYYKFRSDFGKVDYIIHLAATVGVKNVVEKPRRTIFNNIESTDVILNFASHQKIPIIIASSSEVYGLGLNDSFVFLEDDPITFGPSHQLRWSYAASKYIDEILTFNAIKEHDLKATIVRFFNTCGPGQRSDTGMVIPRFIQQAKNKESITVFGDGNQLRSFTHVNDVVEVLYKITQQDKTYSEVINIGNPQQISIKEIAEYIAQLYPTTIEYNQEKIVYSDGSHVEMYRKSPNVSKLTKFNLKNTSFLDYKKIIEDILNTER